MNVLEEAAVETVVMLFKVVPIGLVVSAGVIAVLWIVSPKFRKWITTED